MVYYAVFWEFFRQIWFTYMKSYSKLGYTYYISIYFWLHIEDLFSELCLYIINRMHLASSSKEKTKKHCCFVIKYKPLQKIWCLYYTVCWSRWYKRKKKTYFLDWNFYVKSWLCSSFCFSHKSKMSEKMLEEINDFWK